MYRKFAFILLVWVLTACNFPTRQTPNFEQTLQAGLARTAAVQTALAPRETPVPPPAPVFVLPQAEAPVVVEVEPVPVQFAPAQQAGLPVLSVSVNTNCRSGPARAYSLLGWLLIGEQAVVVGRNQTLNYYVVQNPRGPGNCWLWGQYAAVTGDLNTVPHVDFPAPGEGVPVTGAAYLGVSVATNCRLGPSPLYGIRAVLQPGQYAQVFGRDPTSAWWLVQHPTVGAQCWLWGGYAFLSGNVAGVPVIPVTAPPPPVVIPPPVSPPPPTTAPFLAVSVTTNCRVGPSPLTPIANYLLPGQYAYVLGRTVDASWWLIQNPNQAGLNCWVWGRYAILWGDFASIPVVPGDGLPPPPPTPTPVVVTPVPTQPYLTASFNTNCRTAPSPRYPAVGTLLPGQTAGIFGKNNLGDWWYVQLPTIPEVQCWVWGQYASVFGDTSQVPVLPVAGLGIAPEADPPQDLVPEPQPFLPQPGLPEPLVPPVELTAPPAVGGNPIVPNAPLVLGTPPPGELPDLIPAQPTEPPRVVIIQPPPPLATPLPPAVQPFADPPPASTDTLGAEECIVLNQTVPFGQVFARGVPFEARWTVLNTGASTWEPTDVRAAFLSGDTLHSVPQVALTQAVPPGGMVEIVAPMAAPAGAQSYSTQWGIVRGAQPLCSLLVVIEVQ